MKRILCLCLTLMLLAALANPVLAQEPKIADRAGILTQDQITELEEKARDLADRYDMDVVIVTVNHTEGTDAVNYADDYFDEGGYGLGSQRSGVLLLISLSDRQWAISTSGETIYALTDYGCEQLFNSFRYALSENRFYDAFDTFLDELPQYFQAYRQGHPIDGIPNQGYDGPGYINPADRNDVVYHDPEPDASDLLQIAAISLVIGAAAGGIGLLILRSGMNTARAQSGATNYLLDGSYQLRTVRDIFLYSRVTKRPRPRSTSGGGSSTHTSSMGRSHGGRSGGF